MVNVDGHVCKPPTLETYSVHIAFLDNQNKVHLIMTPATGAPVSLFKLYSELDDLVICALHEVTNGTLPENLTIELAKRMMSAAPAITEVMQ